LGPAMPFFDALGRQAPQMNIPVWKDELYLETHRGVYTSQAQTKRNNRKNEVLLLTAEKFASIASLWGERYPQGELDEAWRRVSGSRRRGARCGGEGGRGRGGAARHDDAAIHGSFRCLECASTWVRRVPCGRSGSFDDRDGCARERN